MDNVLKKAPFISRQMPCSGIDTKTLDAKLLLFVNFFIYVFFGLLGWILIPTGYKKFVLVLLPYAETGNYKAACWCFRKTIKSDGDF